ncbi:MAG: MlaD family protein [Marinibacterium sp.]|nr:MlaD family protein [Marinibacterium sp.]
METRANYVLIGAFTLLGILGLFGFLLWLAKIDVERQYAYYDILFEDVSGLSASAAVRYNGLPVGQVVHLALDKTDSSKVRVRIEVGADTPVRTDTVAQLNAQGVTGVSYVGLTGGSPDAPLLPERGVIKSRPSALQSVFEGAPKLLDQAIHLIEDVNHVFDDENREAISQLLSNLSSASGRLDTVLADFENLSSDLGSAAKEVAGFTTQLGKLSDTAEVTLNTATDTLNNAKGAIDAATGTLDTAKTTFETANTLIQGDLGTFIRKGTDTATAIEGAITSIEGPAVETLDAARDIAQVQLPGLLQQLRDASGTIEGQIESLGTDASELIAQYKEVGAAVEDRVDQTRTAIAAVQDASAKATQTLETFRKTGEAANAFIEQDAKALAAEAQAVLQSARALSDETRVSVALVEGEVNATLASVRAFSNDTLPDVSAKVREFFADGVDTLEKSNETLDSIYAAMDTAVATLGSADTTFKAVNRIVDTDVGPVVSDIRVAVQTATETINKASGAIDGVSDNLLEASQSAQSLMGTVEAIVITNRRQLSDFLRLGLPQIQAFVEESRRLVTNLDRFVDRFERDPARFLLGTTSSEFRR